jgi:dTDP-4-amino-4,6-dideoxygalactose transaminase
MKIPFVDLKAQYQSIKEDIDAAISDVIENTAFIKGKYVDAFEKEFAEVLGAKHCIGVANGTDAIYIVLKMLGVGEGDEVITASNSWISSSETISQAGATPVFADIDEYFTIDTDKLESKISPKTKAIVLVHLYGQMADILSIKELCKKYNLYLIEDCAQSHLSSYSGQYAGTFGDAATFSFFPGKNLGAYGDAGGILTDDDALAEKCRMYSNHGALIKHQHFIEGINSRLDGLHASILSAKLKHLKSWTNLRVERAGAYNSLLKDIPQLQLPKVRPDTVHSYHLYVVKAQQRNGLQQYLKDKGVETAVHYPTPLPFLPAYNYLNARKEDFSEVLANQKLILSLPIFPEITHEQQEYVASVIKEFYGLR